MADLPRPTVDATTHSTTNDDVVSTVADVVISRDGKAKSYRAVGGTEAARHKHMTEQLIGDIATGEWLPSGKKF